MTDEDIMEFVALLRKGQKNKNWDTIKYVSECMNMQSNPLLK